MGAQHPLPAFAALEGARSHSPESGWSIECRDGPFVHLRQGFVRRPEARSRMRAWAAVKRGWSLAPATPAQPRLDPACAAAHPATDRPRGPLAGQGPRCATAAAADGHRRRSKCVRGGCPWVPWYCKYCMCVQYNTFTVVSLTFARLPLRWAGFFFVRPALWLSSLGGPIALRVLRRKLVRHRVASEVTLLLTPGPLLL